MSHSNWTNDLEAGSSRSGGIEDDESSSSPFNIPNPKYASIERLKRWRVRLFHFLVIRLLL